MKVAVITGAASGIGLALSQIYLEKALTVVMLDKDEIKLNKEAAILTMKYPGQIMPLACDVTLPDEVTLVAKHIEEKLGRVDWLYNIAGIIGTLAPVWDLPLESLHQVINVNLYGMMHMIQAFSPLLFKQNFPSHIINMASLYALCAGTQTSAYSMSKHAVLALSESLYFDLIRLNKPVHVSVVFPSFTDTGLLTNSSGDGSALHKALESLLSHSRPALDIAQHIVEEVEQKNFYIFPDKEVKGYCEERAKAMILQENPHQTNVEKLMQSLIKRQESRKTPPSP